MPPTRTQVGNIAGSSVEDGVINKGGNVLVKRMGRIVHEGKLKTLKNLKADADRMVMGTECGIQVGRACLSTCAVVLSFRWCRVSPFVLPLFVLSAAVSSVLVVARFFHA